VCNLDNQTSRGNSKPEGHHAVENLRVVCFGNRQRTWVNFVENKKTKDTKQGVKQRAKSLAGRLLEQSKNLAKNSGLRRDIDKALTNQALMAMIPHGPTISAGYQRVKSSIKVAQSMKRAPVASPCMKKWFDAVTIPFSQNAQMACIPSGSNIDSARYMCFIRGDITIGTGGVGYLLLSPTPYNDTCCALVTNSLFTGSSVSPLTAASTPVAGLTPLSFPNSRFACASGITAPNNLRVQARLVGGGLKLYYTGTELNKGGLMSVYTNPTHQPVSYLISGAPTASLLGAFQETAIFPVTRNPYEYPLTPVREEELSYLKLSAAAVVGDTTCTRYAYPWSGGGQTINSGFPWVAPIGLAGLSWGAPTTVVFITGVAGSTIHFEYALHCEAVGDLTEGMRVGADSDVVGVDTMMAALSRYQIERNSKPHLSSAAVLKGTFADVTRMREAKVRL